MRKTIFSCLIIFVFLITSNFSCCFAVNDDTLLVWNEMKDENLYKLTETEYTSKDNPLKLTCGGAILIDQNSGNIL